MSIGEMITVTPWPDRYTFSPALRAGNTLFISGTTAADDTGQLVGPGDIVVQTRCIYQKLARLLAAAGAGFEHVVQTTEYVTTTENYRRTADVRREFFRPPYPTATGVIVAGLLREGALIEISAVAVLSSGSRDASAAAPATTARSEEMRNRRGYELEMHRIMAAAEPEWSRKYAAFIEATYTGPRLLDRKTKELLQIVVEAALRADVDQIRAHVRVALREGATPREILEALEAVVMPMGGLAFRRGLQAWAAETGFVPPESPTGSA
jgi:enamine deaminase RidA (YjgF/YER057c/UK114 family)/alkylhydroperoxidase/carboxymuconolactone decarboxylase family protein YurZ